MAKKKDEGEPTTAMTTPAAGGLAALNDYALAQFTPEALREAVMMNFEGEELTPGDLDRVRIPAGGGIAWEVPTPEGEIEPAKKLRGIIVSHRTARAYWAKSLDESGGGSPPDCSSRDGKMGIGEPGGVCANCPLNKFGSDAREKGKACKEMKLIFLLKPDSLLPIVVVLPPTSLQPFLMRLTSAAVPYSRVETEIALDKEKNAEGIEYARAVFKAAQKLDQQSADFVGEYAKSMRGAFEAVEVDSKDATGEA
jgi:hypothetical protein